MCILEVVLAHYILFYFSISKQRRKRAAATSLQIMKKKRRNEMGDVDCERWDLVVEGEQEE